jgi:hypothetical protein
MGFSLLQVSGILLSASGDNKNDTVSRQKVVSGSRLSEEGSTIETMSRSCEGGSKAASFERLA